MLSSLKNRRKGNPFFLHRKPIVPYFFHFQSAKGDPFPSKRKKAAEQVLLSGLFLAIPACSLSQATWLSPCGNLLYITFSLF